MRLAVVALSLQGFSALATIERQEDEICEQLRIMRVFSSND